MSMCGDAAAIASIIICGRVGMTYTITIVVVVVVVVVVVEVVEVVEVIVERDR